MMIITMQYLLGKLEMDTGKELVGHKSAKAKNTRVAKSDLYGFPGQ